MKSLNLENMTAAYGLFCKHESGEEQRKAWEAFFYMQKMGFVDADTYAAFVNDCCEM